MSTRLHLYTQACKQYVTGIYPRYRKLNVVGKSFVWFLILFHVALITLLIIYRPGRILQFFYDLAQQFKAMRFGWLILECIMILAAFPPMVGYSTCITMCGFAYGLPGYYIAGSATFIGSGLAFVTLRFLFGRKIQVWASKHEKWQALEQVIVAKGLPLIILIRMSPFPPYVYSQMFFASISAVTFWQFMLANVFYQPRVFLEVFIGSRIAKLSDGNQRGQMDTSTKILNGFSIIAGIMLGVGLGWFLYRQTLEQVESLKGLSAEAGASPTEGLEEADESDPLLQNT